MRTTILTLVLFITCTACLAQNRKTILNEIKSHNNQVVMSSTYSTDADSLKIVTKKYFAQNRLTLHSESDSVLTFSEVILLAYRVSSKGRLPYYRRGSTPYKRKKVRVYIFVSIFTQDTLKNIAVTTSYNTKLLQRDYESETYPYLPTLYQGNYKFNTLRLRQYLYIHFYGNIIPFPKELQSKIDVYNANQTKEKKKIIANRDY